MSKFSCVFFGNPTNKIVTGTAHTWELLIANYRYDRPIRNTEPQSGPIYYTLFGGAHQCCAFYQPRQAARIWCRKTSFLSYTGIFWLFHNKFYWLESHTEYQWREHLHQSTGTLPARHFWMKQYTTVVWEWVQTYTKLLQDSGVSADTGKQKKHCC
jgi:hypothetical protein